MIVPSSTRYTKKFPPWPETRKMHREAINAACLGCMMLAGATAANVGIINSLLTGTPTWAFVFEFALRLGSGALAGGIIWKALWWVRANHPA